VLDPSGAHCGCGARGDDDTEPHDGIAHEEIL
jgi:hypothetical protein